jgi:hypothetical protein
VTRTAIITASAAPVEPSYMLALATSMPVSSADHGLELEDGLQRALRDLGLVGRVAGEELAALDQRIDDDRAVVAIGARAEEAGVAVFRSGRPLRGTPSAGRG